MGNSTKGTSRMDGDMAREGIYLKMVIIMKEIIRTETGMARGRR